MPARVTSGSHANQHGGDPTADRRIVSYPALQVHIVTVQNRHLRAIREVRW
jgi:hypothetical protein